MPSNPPERTVTDADRERVVDLLRRHTAEGDLTLDEFSDRVGLAFEATSHRQLELATDGLPAPYQPPVAGEVETTRTRKVQRWVVAIMSGSRRKGRWRPDEETTALAIMGGCEIDLRNAEITGSEVVIRAIAIMGAIDIIVPEGIAVDLDGLAIMGDKSLRIPDVPRIPGSPLVRVQAFALMGGVQVRTKKDKGERRLEHRNRYEERVRKYEQRMLQHQDRLHRHAEQVAERAQRHAERALERAQRHLPMPPPLPSPPGAPPAPATESRRDEREREEEREREQLEEVRAHAAPDGTVTILFSDIEGYTALTERLGDLRANELLYAHNEILRAQVSAHDGFEVKTAGDGFMVAFAGASRALRCAVGIQRAFAEYAEKHPDEPIRVRCGLNTGEVVREANDFLGRTVIVASRIMGKAKGGEILVSSVLKELTDGSGEFVFGDGREVKLKGVTKPHTVYPVVWKV